MTARDAVLAEFPRCEECADARESWGECGDRDAVADEIIRLRTIKTAAMAVIQQMRRYLPTPGESAGETKISVSAWTALMKQIEYVESLTEELNDGK